MTVLDDLRKDTRQWLRLAPTPLDVHVVTEHVAMADAFERRRVVFTAPDGDRVPAFLLVPTGRRQPGPAVLIHHQHNGERHLGKSEVCGLAGDPLQAFGVALAERGFVVLAPDSVCFEDRRAGRTGVDPDPTDWQQHYNEMTYRLLRGDTLMRKVLDDAAAAISVLAALDVVDPARIGILGHSYGGNTVLFQAALDERVRFACTSGAACSYRNKMQRGTGIEMAEVLPGVVGRLDVDDLLRLAAPRPMLVISALGDPYSQDAPEMVRLARPAYVAAGAPTALEHTEYSGGHAITRDRFDRVVQWVTATATMEQPTELDRRTPSTTGADGPGETTILTSAEKARLDPRVDIESLEEFLRRSPIALRALALNSFYAEPDSDSMTIIGVTDPDLERLWLRAWGRADDGAGKNSDGAVGP